MNIEGIPEYISRTAYLELLSSVGLDPNRIVSLEFGPMGIYAQVLATDANGEPVVGGNEFVKHRVFIRVQD
jgi:hypothetical protein